MPYLFSRRVGAVLVALCLAAFAPALAQQPAAPPAAPPAAKPASPAPNAANPQPTTQQMSLARDVVLYSGIARSFEGVVPQYLNQIGSSLTRTR
ncbi:MAG: hypothetical protein QOC72_4016, partial [Methylobacteriaceae bacterium]|nr:hypothetical protein [Methylobacteriaceae bacterium]